MSSSQWTSHESKASRPMLATALKIEKGIKEVARLRAGDSGCELCILDGRKSSATVFAMTACTVLEITDELLCEIMSRREELKDALTPNQKLQSVSERLKVYWNHESLADEAAERINMLRIEAGERRLKVSQHLVSIGVVTVFEKLVNEESKETNQTLAKAGLGLMVGAEKREEKLLEVTDGTVECLKAMIDATRFDEEWHGHRYNFATVLLSARLLVLNDKNKRKFAQNAMIPFVLSLLKDDDEDVVRLATAILLELSFAMRARWLVRPVLTIWRNYVGDENQGRDALSHQPPMTDMVDLAAPTYTVKARATAFARAVLLPPGVRGSW
ncbi:hypothetical protein T484DRAFT_3474338 [Baffinella frigidus]|nr:hypothetical protein T484DRAFT_3474338 [Cryptophyta sp. CCMP2293]